MNKLDTDQQVAEGLYQAPEALLSFKEYTTASDVWSVGCIFAELLNRKPLFPTSQNQSQIDAIVDFLGSHPMKILTIVQQGEKENGF